jgi:3',5'-cyclic-nucleotide phosphodiesterase
MLLVSLALCPCGELDAAPRPGAFRVIVVGASGGLYEDDLSCFMVGGGAGEAGWLALDAGTLLSGLRTARARGALPAGVSESEFLASHVRGFLISHPHLDHVAGLAIASTDDTRKPVLGLASTLDALRDHLFNWKLWPNFTDEGNPPRLGRRPLVRLAPGIETAVAGTSFTVEAHPLHHGGAESTGFLLRRGDSQLLYLGDTGADEVEKSERLLRLWRRVAPLVRAGSLRAIFVEVSYPDGRPDGQLYGHLTPRWLLVELRRLAKLARPEAPSLAGVVVVVTHVKPPFDGTDPRKAIRGALKRAPDLGARFVLPEAGQRLDL